MRIRRPSASMIWSASSGDSRSRPFSTRLRCFCETPMSSAIAACRTPDLTTASATASRICSRNDVTGPPWVRSSAHTHHGSPPLAARATAARTGVPSEYRPARQSGQVTRSVRHVPRSPSLANRQTQRSTRSAARCTSRSVTDAPAPFTTGRNQRAIVGAPVAMMNHMAAVEEPRPVRPPPRIGDPRPSLRATPHRPTTPHRPSARFSRRDDGAA
jgi:hypothetical protein